jgi:gluconate kinase
MSLLKNDDHKWFWLENDSYMSESKLKNKEPIPIIHCFQLGNNYKRLFNK